MQPTDKPVQSEHDAAREPVKDPVREQPDKGQSKFDPMLVSFQKLLRRGAITKPKNIPPRLSCQAAT